ncbi:hypothetical protein [Gordonia malaquae]|uniref:hypothetical protein n=1 Tax=Gordonia malaquae TaxID=410332 RepID=UPI003015A4A5
MTVLAWESNSRALWEIGHGLGAFITSPGFAALAALVVGILTAVQVSRNRTADTQKHQEILEADRVYRRREQLWSRYIWTAEHPSAVSADVLAEIVKNIRTEAAELDDASLLAVVAEQRKSELNEASTVWRSYRSRRDAESAT